MTFKHNILGNAKSFRVTKKYWVVLAHFRNIWATFWHIIRSHCPLLLLDIIYHINLSGLYLNFKPCIVQSFIIDNYRLFEELMKSLKGRSKVYRDEQQYCPSGKLLCLFGCFVNISNLFEYWANPVVHLCKLKSSMVYTMCWDYLGIVVNIFGPEPKYEMSQNIKNWKYFSFDWRRF